MLLKKLFILYTKQKLCWSNKKKITKQGIKKKKKINGVFNLYLFYITKLNDPNRTKNNDNYNEI